MKDAPPLVQQRFVGAVADERVAEHELAAVGADEEVARPGARCRSPGCRAGGAAHRRRIAGRGRRRTAARTCPRSPAGPCARGPAPGSIRAGSTARASPALRRSCRRKSGLPSARSTQLATMAGRHRRRQGRQPARIVGVQRGEVEADQRRAVEHGAPGAGRRVAGEARRHDQQQRLPRGEQGERGQALERPGVGPVDVLDHQQQRRGRRSRRRQLAHGMQRPLLAGRGAHRRGEGAKRGRRRHVEQVVEEQLAVGGDRPGRGGALDRVPGARPRRLCRRRRAGCAPGCGSRPGRSRRRSRAPRRRGRKSRASGLGRELGDEPRLADAGIAADDETRLRLRSAQASAIAAKSRSSSSRPTSGRRRLPAPPIAADPVRRKRPLLALDLDRRAFVGLEVVGHLLPGVGADEHLARPRPGCAGGRPCSRRRRSGRRCRRARRCAGRRRGRC